MAKKPAMQPATTAPGPKTGSTKGNKSGMNPKGIKSGGKGGKVTGPK